MPVEEWTLMAPTLFGLEGLAAAELRRLGLRDVRGEDGRVLCRGSLADICRMNLQLRTAERVLVVLGRFAAEDFPALFDGILALPWEEWIPKTGKFPVRCQCVDSQLHAEVTCEKMVKKAAATRLGNKYGLSVLPETGADYPIRCLIFRNTVTVGLDTSGDALHKRGYRALGVEASLRETLAAGLVLLSRYRGKGVLADPFCGSGTILIEGAMIAKNRAPGLNRSFASQKWGRVPQACWLDAAQEALDGEYAGEYALLGGDIDPAAVELARRNARLAEVEDMIRFTVGDARNFRPAGDAGRIVTNPPYGKRLLEAREAEALYGDMGRTLGRLPPGWELYVLSGHPEFEKAFGKKAQRRRKVYNGNLMCQVYSYLS